MTFIMNNHTNDVSYFILSAYFNTAHLKYLFFILIAFLYALILTTNILLIAVICLNRTLHEPMYAFLCSLFLNEIYGSTALFPFLLLHILRDVHAVPHSFCFLQIFCMYSYATVEFFTLAVMSYDRYVAICFPLQYNTRMNYVKVSFLVAFSWSCPFFFNIMPIALSLRLKLCGNVIPKVYCDNYYIVKMACSDITVNNIYGIIGTILVVFAPLGYILFTYVHIFRVCFSGSQQTKQKVLSTCTPHFVTLVNFTFGACFEVLQSRFTMTFLPNEGRILLSLYWLTCPPILNPLMYGLNFSKIRTSCMNLFR